MLCPGTPRSVRAMARPDFPRSLAEFQDRFASEADCHRYLVACRWPDGFRCPRCGGPDAYGRDPGIETSSEVFVGSESHRGIKKGTASCPEKRSDSKAQVAPFHYIIK